MVDIATLIDAVQKRPSVWDQYSKEYYNRELVVQSWKQIGEILGVKHELAKSKWKHLRDNYRAELKKIMKSAEDDELPKYQSSWVWFDSLFFLREFVFSKCHRHNRMASRLDDSSPAVNPVNIKVEPDFDIEDEPSASSEQSEVLYRREDIGQKRTLQYDLEEGSKRFKTDEVQDDSYHFTMSILPSLRRLPLESQMLVRIKIHELIYQEYIKSHNDK